jgi:hypothetical protein
MISILDFVLLPLYLVVIYFVAYIVKSSHLKRNPCYKYMIWGLHAKIFGAISICVIYVYYYGGGDIITYYNSSVCLNKLAGQDFGGYLDIMFNNLTDENYSLFSERTGYPARFMYNDPHTFAVVRFGSIFMLLGLNNFLLGTVLLASVSYIGAWKLYTSFAEKFPTISWQMGIAILFVPSSVFWGSGLLKDTFTFAATCWFVYGLFNILERRKKYIISTVIVVVAAFVLISFKPYILVALLPAAAIWAAYRYLKFIRSRLLRMIAGPAIIVLLMGTGVVVMTQFGSLLGKYSLETVLDTAKLTQADLVREAYGQNSFNIGEFDASVASVLAKMPSAIFAALFRPLIWEVRNPVMLLSGLENLIMMWLVLSLIWRTKLRVFYSVLKAQPLVLFCLIFTIFFGFAVGLTTANFGALVRYKIPLMPFFVAAILILRHYTQVLRFEGKEKFSEYLRTGRFPARKYTRKQQAPATTIESSKT